MARELRGFTVTIPAGTAKSAPLTFPVTFPPREVTEIEIVVPPGPRGEVGFQLAMSGFQVWPVESGQYFVTDGEVIHWPVEGQANSGAWQIIAYNTGNFDHTLQIRFLVELVSIGPAPAPTPIDNADLASSPPPLDVTGTPIELNQAPAPPDLSVNMAEG